MIDRYAGAAAAERAASEAAGYPGWGPVIVDHGRTENEP
jgi:hypothetical protein